MLTQIQVEYGDIAAPSALTVPIIGVTPKDSLLLRKITGLNPPDVNLFVGEYAQDGGTYQGRRVGVRNVVMTFDLNPNPGLGETIAGLRTLLYKTFMDPLVEADFVKVNLVDSDSTVRYFVGYGEKFETEIFDVDNMCQISLICPDPYIRDQNTTVLTDSSGWLTVPFTYAGSAETGFEVEIYPSGSSSLLTLYVNGKTMEIAGSFDSTYVVYINTVRGSRKMLMALQTDVDAWRTAHSGDNVAAVWAGLTGLSQTTSLIGGFSVDSDWLELHSQDNIMKVYSTVAGDGDFAIKLLSYLGSYWGV